jgi:hypothetical protein
VPEKNLRTLFDQVIAWAGALKILRPGMEEEGTRAYTLVGSGKG